MEKKDHRELIMEDGEKLISISMQGKKHLGWHIGENGKKVSKIDDNQIEISYREDDENGWGIGCDEYFSTADIKSMADSIRSVIFEGQPKAEYSCRDDLFRICIEYDQNNDLFSFTAALLETLVREYHIIITKTCLTRALLDEYIQPFFEWEKEYPII